MNLKIIHPERLAKEKKNRQMFSPVLFSHIYIRGSKAVSLRHMHIMQDYLHKRLCQILYDIIDVFNSHR